MNRIYSAGAVCGLPAGWHNRFFADLASTQKIGSSNSSAYLESVKQEFASHKTGRRFPNDEEFKRALQEKDLYNFKLGSYWLRRLENHNRVKELVDISEYSIEHIMPRNPKLPNGWKDELGHDWEYVHAKYLHTLGNLTLTGYNSKYGDHSFQEKRDMEHGFKESPLNVNQGLGQIV